MFCEFGMFLDHYDAEGINRNHADSLFRKRITPMQLLLYLSGADQNNKRLEAAVHNVIPANQIERFKSLTDFGERLRMPIEPDSIAVLSASNRDELQRMQPLRGLLTEIFVVLVVPDRKKSTIELAHLLLPRFLSQKNDNFLNLGKVLDKIVLMSH